MVLVPVATIVGMIACLFSHNLAWIPLLYVAVIIYEKDVPNRGGRKHIEWFRKLRIWKLAAGYYPIRLVKTCELDPGKNYLLGYHPHGVLATGTLSMCTDACNWDAIFPGIKRRTIGLSAGFHIPGFREVFLWTGACSSNREAIKFCLTEPSNGVTCLVVGGAQESLSGNDSTVDLTLLKRKGFVKLALETGADLLPCFAFGEQQIFNLYSEKGSKIRQFQEYLKKCTTIAPVIFSGRGIFQYSFGLLPYRRPINVVVGSPISVTKTLQPTRDEVDELHSKYMEALRKLYLDHNETYGDSRIELVIN